MKSDRDLRELVVPAITLSIFRIGGAAAIYATQVSIARWLGAEALGEYAFAASLMIVLASIAAFGLPIAATRVIAPAFENGDTQTVRRYVTASRRVTVGVGVATALVAAAAIATIMPSDLRVGATYVALAAVPVYALMLLYSGLAQGLSRPHLSAIPMNSVRPLLLVAAVITLWSLDIEANTATVVAIHLAIVAGVVAEIARRVNRLVDSTEASDCAPTTAPPDGEARRWAVTAAPLLISGLASAYLPELVILMGGFRADTTELAILNAVLRTGVAALFVMTAIDHVVLPRISAAFASSDRAALQHTIQRANLVRSALVGAAVAVLLAGGGPLLSVFGDGFDAGYRALVIVLVGIGVRTAAGGAPEILSATTGTRSLLIANLAGIGCGGLAFVALSDTFVVEAGAIAYAIATALIGWLCRRSCRRALGVDPSVFARFTDTPPDPDFIDLRPPPKAGQLRIALLTELFPPSIGGQELRFADLARSLSDRGHDVTVYTIDHTGDLPEIESVDGARVRRISNGTGYTTPTPARLRRRPGVVWRYARWCRSSLDGADVDVVIANQWPVLHLLFLPAAIRDRTVVDWCEVRADPIMRFVQRVAPRRVAHNIAVEPGVAAHIAAVSRRPVATVTSGVAARSYHSAPQTDRADLLCLGRVAAHKHPAMVIAAFEIMARDGFEERLVIAGTGPELPAVEALVAASPFADRIRVAGAVSEEEKRHLLGRSRALLMPSEREGFPRTAVEAMASGLPIITTRHPGNGTVAVVERYASGVSTDLSAAGLAAATRDVLDDWPRYSDAGRRAAVEELDWDIVIDRFLRQFGVTAAVTR